MCDASAADSRRTQLCAQHCQPACLGLHIHAWRTLSMQATLLTNQLTPPVCTCATCAQVDMIERRRGAAPGGSYEGDPALDPNLDIKRILQVSHRKGQEWQGQHSLAVDDATALQLSTFKGPTQACHVAAPSNSIQ
jgi:hypothetical protein